ncbi:hypothetical protein ABPG72_003263 [Tetrahymena utriculariae]
MDNSVSEQELGEQGRINLSKYKVIVMYFEGISITEIARRVNMDRKNIYKLIDKFKKYESVEIDLRHQNTGRPKIITTEMEEEIKQSIQEKDHMTLNQIHEMIEEEIGIECHRSTVFRFLQENGRFLIPAWTLSLSEPQKQQRLDYCNYHIEKRTTFKKVIFTNESSFILNRVTQKLYALDSQQRPKIEKINPDSSIMVWGAICYEGLIHLQVVEGRLNHEGYLDILKRFMEEGLPTVTSSNYKKFQQDNAPPHRPTVVKEFIKSNGFQVLKHPPNSPDLNPIEQVWYLLKGLVEKRKPQTKQQLEDAIFDSFDEIKTETVQNYINHLRSYLFGIRSKW